MLAGVSHDLRTPLSRMKLQLEFLPDSPDRRDMEKDIDDMDRMITGYIDFASNAVVETPEPTDIAVMIEDSVRAHRDAGKQIAVNTGDETVPEIPLRPRVIRRAIDNLITNALRYSHNCTITVELVQDTVQVIIDDDGPGIPKESRLTVLRPFVRLDPQDNHSGAGLGLSIANDAVLAHGGVMLLGDSPLGGLRVRLQLPV